MDPQNIADVINRQRIFFAGGWTRSLPRRKESFRRMEKYLVEHRDALLAALDEDLGKPGLEAYLAEYHFILQEMRLVRKSLDRWLAPQGVKTPIYFQPCKSRVEFEPYGVCLIVAPWNYPIQLALSPLIAAVAAGNTVVLKPSEVSSASERFLVEMVAHCFAPEHVTTVTGGPEVAAQLLDETFEFIFFTGSTEIGKIVAQKAAVHLTPCILELGGKCPVVVDASADLTAAARRIMAGKMFNAGQTCFAPDFVVAHHDIKDELIEQMRLVMEEIPWQEEMARIVNRKHFNRLLKLLDGYSGEVIAGFEDDESQLLMAPRILTEATWKLPVMEEEIFGPLLPVLSYEGEVSLIRSLSARSSPLALYLFGRDQAWVRRMMDGLPSGGVCVNDTMKQGSSLHLPFGGVGDSGYGRYRGQTGVLALSYQRSVVSRPAGGKDWAELLPPYGKRFEWIKKWLR